MDRTTSARPSRHLSWQLNVRVSAAQYDKLYRRAWDAGMTISQLVRRELALRDPRPPDRAVTHPPTRHAE